MNFGELSHLLGTKKVGLNLVHAATELAFNTYINYIYQRVKNILRILRRWFSELPSATASQPT
ncbi:MAG: hypothetical protein ACJA2Q_001039 [Pseudohongiellaceae bacterium]|jgi:hypothetical protein